MHYNYVGYESEPQERGFTLRTGTPAVTDLALQERMISLIRAFGLHRPQRTPYGQLVSVAEAYVLMELVRETSLLQKDLAPHLRLEKSTVSRLVGAMEGRGWVERTKNPGDRRAMELRLTDARRRTAQDLAEARRAKISCWEAIPQEERTSVVRALDILEEAMHGDR